VAVPELTETTIRYLYATTWLPFDAAGNLLHIAMWSLQRQGLVEFEQLRTVMDAYSPDLGD
jgi:hypothetical protein